MWCVLGPCRMGMTTSVKWGQARIMAKGAVHGLPPFLEMVGQQ